MDKKKTPGRQPEPGQSNGPVGAPCRGSGETLVEYFSALAQMPLYKMGPCPGCPECPKSLTVPQGDIRDDLEGLEKFVYQYASKRTGTCGEPGCTSCPECKSPAVFSHLKAVQEWVGAHKATLGESSLPGELRNTIHILCKDNKAFQAEIARLREEVANRDKAIENLTTGYEEIADERDTYRGALEEAREMESLSHKRVILLESAMQKLIHDTPECCREWVHKKVCETWGRLNALSPENKPKGEACNMQTQRDNRDPEDSPPSPEDPRERPSTITPEDVERLTNEGLKAAEEVRKRLEPLRRNIPNIRLDSSGTGKEEGGEKPPAVHVIKKLDNIRVNLTESPLPGHEFVVYSERLKMEENKPRRTGTIEEHQHGHWFLYVTEWTDATEGRRHRELEIYYAKAHPIWNTTDPSKFEEAKRLFFLAPQLFQGHPDGELPTPEIDAALRKAFIKKGMLFPETEAEVAEAEKRLEGVDIEIPESVSDPEKAWDRMHSKWSEHNIVPDGDRFWCKNCEVHFAPGEVHFGVSIVHPSAMIEVELCDQCDKPLGPNHPCLPRDSK